MWPPFISIGKKCRCPVITAKRSRKTSFIPIRPGNNKYLVNYQVVSLGETSPPSGSASD